MEDSLIYSTNYYPLIAITPQYYYPNFSAVAEGGYVAFEQHRQFFQKMGAATSHQHSMTQLIHRTERHTCLLATPIPTRISSNPLRHDYTQAKA